MDSGFDKYAVFDTALQDSPLTPDQARLMGPLIQAMSEGVVIQDADGRIIDCNLAAERILGLTLEQMAGRSSVDERWATIREDGSDFPGVDHPAMVTLRTGEPQRNVVMGVRRPDGTLAWILINSQPVSAPEDVAAAVLTTFSDISELQRTKCALGESEARFRNMADDAPAPIWLADAQGRHNFFNRSWLAYTGLRAADAGAWREAVHIDDLPRLEATLQRACSDRLPASTEYRLRGADGSYRWFLQRIAPRVGEHGELLGLTGIDVDIDGRRQGEDTIRKLSQALEQSATRVVITDHAGAIEYVNPALCEAYGYSATELTGQNPRIFKSGTTPAEVYRELWETLSKGETWRGELSNATRSGERLLESVTISPVRDDDGKTRHYVALKEDITRERADADAKRRLDARLARLERMQTLNTLAGGVAHEFNNILVAILGYSDLGARLLGSGGDSQRVVSYLQEIGHAGERARALVRQLLAFGRASALEREQLEVGEVIASIRLLLEAGLPNSIEIETDIAEDLPTLELDSSAIQQVVMNLCLNARDAMPAGGKIRISGRRLAPQESLCDSCQCKFGGDYVSIEVADQGKGMDEATRARMFEPFFTTKAVGLGAGMGLAVVHGVVHQYGGHVRVHGDGSPGTRVQVLLPVPAEPSEG